MKALKWSLIGLMFMGVTIAAPPKAVKSVPLEIKGDTITVVKSFPCTITAGGGSQVYIWSVPDAVKATSLDNVLTITAAPKGTHRIGVVGITVDFENKKVVKDTGETYLAVGDVPTPPGPGPGPTPPGPLSPLAKSFKDAAAGDSASLVALAAFWGEAGSYLDDESITNPKQLRDRMRADAVKMVPATKLVKVRELIADEWDKDIKLPENQTFTVDHKQVIRAFIKRMAAALEEASK